MKVNYAIKHWNANGRTTSKTYTAYNVDSIMETVDAKTKEKMITFCQGDKGIALKANEVDLIYVETTFD